MKIALVLAYIVVQVSILHAASVLRASSFMLRDRSTVTKIYEHYHGVKCTSASNK